MADSLADRKDKQFADLGAAINNFTQAAQQFKVTNALRQASQTVQQVKASAMKEEEKRSALQGLANNLVLNMTQFGADPQAIQQASGAIMPPKDPVVQTPEQAYLMGTPEQQGRGKELLETEFMQKLALLRATPKAEKEKKPISDAVMEKVKAMQESEITLESMLAKVTKDPKLVGPRATIEESYLGRGKYWDSNYAEFRTDVEKYFNAIRTQVTGAAAPVAELELLKKGLPTGTERPAQFLAKANASLAMARKVRKKYLSNLKKMRDNPDAFLEEAAAEGGESAGSAVTSGKINIPGYTE